MSSLSDLQVKRESFREVLPKKIKEKRSLFLSNIDQIFVGCILNSLYFYNAHPAISFNTIVSLITEALSKILLHKPFEILRSVLSQIIKLRKNLNSPYVVFQ
ncbi:hypothetical protein SUGI_0254600 [Cryptomeria japonica]|nr:hypothetical protein SUGI_0254600 [Cryptomeria japonica]